VESAAHRAPDGVRLVAEPDWSAGTDIVAKTWRIRRVRAASLGDIGEDALASWGDGGTVRLRVRRGSPAEELLGRARGKRVVAVRGRTSLGPVTIEGDAVLLSFGTGLPAYARAQQQLQLLTTPRLPALRRVGASGLAPNTALTLACVIVPVLLSLAWLVFVRRFDRAHPEPRWLVGVTFALGAASTIPAGLLETGLAYVSPYLDPRLASLGGRPFALPLAFLVFTVSVGLVEEGAKLAATTFAARRREFDEPVDGVVYGIVASLGFAAAENVLFFAAARLAPPLVIARAFMSIPAHMFFGAIWGFGLGMRLVEPRRKATAWLVAAAALHGLFDAFLSIDGAGILAVALNVALASAFVVFVRRALRHGVVDEAARAIAPEQRRLFRVGRPTLFAFSAVAIHLLAFGIFMLGAYYQIARHRPSFGFVAGSTILVLALAAAAYGIVTALPLDVAVDPYGVTFAGAARPWRSIRGYTLEKDRVVVDCENGPLVLGPGSQEVIERIAEALRERVA
jgi:RsiW-degrading membrane proteinase PrsW (M82 family)